VAGTSAAFEDYTYTHARRLHLPLFNFWKKNGLAHTPWVERDEYQTVMWYGNKKKKKDREKIS